MRPQPIAFCATPHRQLVPADFAPGPYLNSADREAGVVFRLKQKRKTTPAASASVAARNFIDDAATPPCGDARRGVCLLQNIRSASRDLHCRFIRYSPLLVLVCAFFIRFGMAQTTGTISGFVKDTSGAVVPGAM